MLRFVNLRTCIATVVVGLMLLAADSARAAELTGHWRGTWESCVTGHKGTLNADFCRVDACHYKVTFTGRFMKIMPFRYSMTMRIVSETPTGVTLSGSKNLGRLEGGVYNFTATTDGCHFVANYCSSKDRGQFRLSKCCN